MHLNHFLKATARRRSGFTIVELLIVIVVIAILAAITIVAYNGITRQAVEASMKSDLNSAAKTIEVEKATTNSYPADGVSLKSSPGNQLSYKLTDGVFCVSVSSTKSTKQFRITSSNGQIEEGKCAPILTATTTGDTHSCVLASGQAYCWGRNSNGNLGDGTTTDRSTPTAVNTSGVLNGKTITTLTAGGDRTCAIADGLLYCWGSNASGQLGDGTTTRQLLPIAVNSGLLAGKTVTAVSGNDSTTCAVASSQLYCWGSNGNGQFGNGTTTASPTPTAVDVSGVLAGKTVTTVDASDGSPYTCAIASGQAYCWGYNGTGQLGDGTTTNRLSPVAVNASGALAGKTVTAISASSTYTCAIASGQLYCWGSNSNGQLGNGTTTSSLTPIAVNGDLVGKTVTALSTSVNHVCVVASGQLYCWGYNTRANLGDGTTTARSVPTAVNTAGVLSGKTPTAVSAGTYHSCAIASNESYCWGWSVYGNIGDGTTSTTRLTAVPVLALP